MGEDVWPGIRRVLAPNSSALTGEGTNTWIIGTGLLAVIDPGTALPAHLDAILGAVGGARVVGAGVRHRLTRGWPSLSRGTPEADPRGGR